MFQITEFLATCDIAELPPEGWVTVDVRDLKDYEKDTEKIKQKIMFVTGLWAMGAKVCIRCVCGMNRSNTIAIATLCYVDSRSEDIDEDWEIHRKYVKRKVPRLLTELDIEKTAKKALTQLYSKWGRNDAVTSS